MQVLLGPHVSEKATSLAEAGQIVFKVRNDATKSDVRQAVELLVRGQGRARVRRAHPGEEEALRSARRHASGVEEGLCAARTGPRHQFHGRRVTRRGAAIVALRKLKPTSPGQRFVVRVVKEGLHQGRSVRAPAPSQSTSAAAATTRAASRRGTRAAGTSATTASSTSSATRTALRAASSGSSTIRIARRISRSCCTPTASAATSWRRKARRPATRSCPASTRRSSRAVRCRLKNIPIGSLDSLHRAEAGQGRANGAQRRGVRAGRRARRRVRHGALALRRDAQGARELPRHDRRGR